MKRRNEKKHVIDFLFLLQSFSCWRHHRSPCGSCIGILQPAGEDLVSFLFGTDGTCLCDGENAPE